MVSENLYKELTELKNPGESYTKVIDRFIHKKDNKKNIMSFAGAWNYMKDEEVEEMKSTIKSMRKRKRGLLKW